MRSLRAISDDCGSSEYTSTIPSNRRKEIIIGLTNILPQILELIINQFNVNFNEYEAGKIQPNILNTILNTVCFLMEWIPQNILFTKGNSLVIILMGILQEDAFCMMSIESLLVLTNRKIQADTIDLFRSFSIEFLNFILNGNVIKDSMDKYLFNQKLCLYNKYILEHYHKLV